MEFKLISEVENNLFNRREIEGEFYSNIVPSREEVAKFISEKFNTGIDTIKIKTIKGRFGQKAFLIVANIYKSKIEKDKIENKKKKDMDLEKKQLESKKSNEFVEEIKEIKPIEKISEETNSK